MPCVLPENTCHSDNDTLRKETQWPLVHFSLFSIVFHTTENIWETKKSIREKDSMEIINFLLIFYLQKLQNLKPVK